jgi:hypothetical protein
MAEKKAVADLDNAQKTREVAKIALEEYQNGTFLQEVASLEADTQLARSEVARARDRLEWTGRMLKRDRR